MRTTAAALRTTTGTQDITVAGMPTAKAALFVVTKGVGDAVRCDHNCLSVGATDGTRSWVFVDFSEDAVAASNVWREASSSLIAKVIDGAGTDLVTVAFSAWITGGVTINVTATDGNAYEILVVLFYGDDMSVYVGSFTAQNAGASTDINCGFMPTAVITATHSGTFSTADANYLPGIGLAHYEESTYAITQSFAGMREADAQATMNVHQRLNSADVIGQLASTTGVDWSNYISAFLSNGFRITGRTGLSGGDTPGYLAFRPGNLRTWVGIYTTPTSSGADWFSDIGFQPQYVGLVMSSLTALDTDANANDDGYGFTSFDKTGSEHAQCVVTGDALADSNTFSVYASVAVNLDHDDAGAADDLIDATYTQMRPDGFELLYGNVDAANPRKFICLAVEDLDLYESSSTSSTATSLTSASTPSSLTSLTSLSTSSSQSHTGEPESQQMSDGISPGDI